MRPIILAALALCAAGAPTLADNTSTTDQTGHNFAFTGQFGDGNAATTVQNGRNNISGIFQSGNDLAAQQVQTGENNMSAIMQADAIGQSAFGGGSYSTGNMSISTTVEIFHHP